MLAAFRSFAKSPFAIALVFLLMLAFLLVGTTDMFKNILFGGIGTDVVKAGSRSVSQYEFKLSYDRTRKQMEQQYGQPITIEMAVERGLDQQMMRELLTSESFAELMRRLGVRSPKKMLQDELRKTPDFFDQVTGEFSQQSYAAVLAENNLTPTMFEKGMADGMARYQFVRAAADGLKAPLAYASLGGAVGLEQRDISYFVVTPQSVGQIAPPTDAEVQAFVKANSARLMRPEFRGLTVVKLSRKAFEQSVTLDPAEVQRRFDFEKDSLSRPETRTVVQIPAKDAAQAAALVTELNRGGDARIVAGRLGVKPIIFDNKARTAFFDPAIAAKAFALPQGGVDIVKGGFGLAVIKVEGVVAGQAATLEANRAAIEAKVRADLADRKVSEASKVYEDTRATGADMLVAAQKAGLPTATVAPVSAQGAGEDGKPVAGLSPNLLKAAFEATQGQDSEIIQDGEGEYFIVRVDRVVAPALPPMDQLRPFIMRTLMIQKMQDAVRARAAALEARVRKGETIEAVAASAGASVQKIAGLSRMNAQEQAALGRDFVGAAFGAKKGDIYAAATSGGMAVATVTALRPGDVNQVAVAARQQQTQFSEQIFQDIGQTIQQYGVSSLKAKSSLANARAAIGGPAPEPAAKPKGK